MSSTSNHSPQPKRAGRQRRLARHAQLGLSLLELLIAVSIGLLIIGAAIGTLILSRGAASTTSEISQLQQQAAYGLRVVGLQLRQASTLEPVIPASNLSAITFVDFAPGFTTVSGTDGAGSAPDTLTVGTQSPSILTPSLRRDCLANELSQKDNVFQSAFSVNSKKELICTQVGLKTDTQPLIANVADFQVRYRVNLGTSDPAAAAYRSLSATDMTGAYWDRVQSIELCLDLVGNESIPDGGIAYINCQGTSTTRGNRNHLVYRNVFDVRRQRVFTAPLGS